MSVGQEADAPNAPIFKGWRKAAQRTLDKRRDPNGSGAVN